MQSLNLPFVNCQQALSKVINSLLLIQISSILKAGIHHGLLVKALMSLVVSTKHPVNLYSGKGQTISLILSLSVVSGLAMELMREGTSMAAA